MYSMCTSTLAAYFYWRTNLRYLHSGIPGGLLYNISDIVQRINS